MRRFAGDATVSNRLIILGALGAALLPWSLSAWQLANPVLVRPGDIVITGGRLFDSVRDTDVPNTGIVVRGGVFQSIGADLAAANLTGATVVRLTDDDYVLPGLFDLHAHYAMDQRGACDASGRRAGHDRGRHAR